VGLAQEGEVPMDYLAHQYPACTGTVLPSYMKFLEAKYSKECLAHIYNVFCTNYCHVAL
jgi:hypothetical protein